MLKEFGVRDTDLNLLVDVLFAITFSVARMGFGPYITYVTVTADNPILIKVRMPPPSAKPFASQTNSIATTSDPCHPTARMTTCSVASALSGDGDGAAAGERLLVPADPQDGQVQARQEEAAATAAGQARRRQLMSSDRAGDLQELSILY
jgi:hypothetical protein